MEIQFTANIQNNQKKKNEKDFIIPQDDNIFFIFQKNHIFAIHPKVNRSNIILLTSDVDDENIPKPPIALRRVWQYFCPAIDDLSESRTDRRTLSSLPLQIHSLRKWEGRAGLNDFTGWLGHAAFGRSLKILWL